MLPVLSQVLTRQEDTIFGGWGEGMNKSYIYEFGESLSKYIL